MKNRKNNPNPSPWGPDNPHPLSRMKTELVWEGKYDEYGNRRTVKLPPSPLPLQRIESIDAPRDQAKAEAKQKGLPFVEEEFRQQAHRDDFRNLLIWGDNKLVMAALLEQFRGKIDLIYIDPPFDVGADFTLQVRIGDEGEKLQKEQSILEAVAYRDTWGKGSDSYLHMMYERLSIMRDLLSDNGTIYVHLDEHIGHYVSLLLDEIFGKDLFLNDIIWYYPDNFQGNVNRFANNHNMILVYSKKFGKKLNKVEIPLDKPVKRDKRIWDKELGKIVAARDNNGKLIYETYTTKFADDVWIIGQSSVTKEKSSEFLGYATQKPEELIRRVILASTDDGGLVADFFCGSGTTMAVAEKLGRRWIGVDLGRYAIHVSRKRLIQVQRELHTAGKPYRSFDVYNLGRYERQWWQVERLQGADGEHRRIVLQFYKAAPLEKPPNPLLHGRKHGAYVHVAQIDTIFAFADLQAVAMACQGAGGRELHCLAWEFEMELTAKKQAIEALTGLTIRLKYIPREIMEPNRTECQFFEAGYLEAKVVKKGKKVDVELLRFTPALAEAPEAEMAALRERAVRSPFDFIDFWAVDFEWRDGKPFEHHWQDFRTRKDRSLKTRSDIGWEYKKNGPYQICVKVIDVFGVDTTTVIQVEV